MIRLVWNTFLLCIIALASVWLANNPGSVRVDWLGYRVETTASVALTAIVVIALFYHYFIVRPLYFISEKVKVFFAGRRVGQKVALTQVKKETEKYVLLERAMASLEAGDLKTAKKLRKRLDKKFIGEKEKILPFEARLEEALGNIPQALLLYAQMAENSETHDLGIQGQIRLYRSNGQYEMALSLMQNQLDDKKIPLSLLEEAFEMQIADGKYADALLSLEKAYKENMIDKVRMKKIKASVLLEQALATSDEELKELLMRQASQTDENSVQAVLTVAKYDAVKGDVKKARAEIRKLWKTAPCFEAYKAYIGLEATLPAVEQVKLVEKLIAENPNAPVNDLVLADVSAQAGLIGQAKASLTKYLNVVGQSRQAFNLLANLADTEKDTEASAGFREKALLAPEEKPFICDSCKTELTTWHNICPACHKPAFVRFKN